MPCPQTGAGSCVVAGRSWSRSRGPNEGSMNQNGTRDKGTTSSWCESLALRLKSDRAEKQMPVGEYFAARSEPAGENGRQTHDVAPRDAQSSTDGDGAEGHPPSE